MSSPFAGCSPVQRAYRYRFYPTAEQRLSFEAHFGAARWVWNRAFANFFAIAKYPRFRKRSTAQSIRFQLDQRQVHRTFDANRRLVLPGLGPLS